MANYPVMVSNWETRFFRNLQNGKLFVSSSRLDVPGVVGKKSLSEFEEIVKEHDRIQELQEFGLNQDEIDIYLQIHEVWRFFTVNL